MAGLHEYTASEAGCLAFGQAGFDYQTSAGALTGGPWVAIIAPAVDSVVNVTASVGDDASGFLLKVGVPFYGPFTSITLVAGMILAYRG
jgi:hypothetical protein